MTTPSAAVSASPAKRATAAIVGPGNIGTDLMYKLLRSPHIEPRWMIGVDPDSEGLKRAAAEGLEASADGVDWLLAQSELPDIVFEATSAYVHVRNAPKYRNAGIRAVDLTPAARGPFVVPPANLLEHIDEMNVNMVTCGGQATIPMVHAVSRVVPVDYAEIVATVSSASAGPGTRQNIDEFTRTTSKAVEVIGRATTGKAIIILNPAEPPLMMRDTIYCSIPLDADIATIDASIRAVAADVATYVPGYHLVADPQFDVPFGTTGRGRVAIFVEVEGAGDFLPPYAGNLDIMTAAATKVGNEIAQRIRTKETA
jgi:acetaldehyde dehydrogenase